MADPVWEVTPGLTAYPAALTRMQGIAAGIRAGSESERIWLVEHPHSIPLAPALMRQNSLIRKDFLSSAQGAAVAIPIMDQGSA